MKVDIEVTCKYTVRKTFDVPENLDRRFLIAEILEIVEEFNDEREDMQVSSELSETEEFVLPKNYNESQVSCVLRNPAWLFVFWNISENDAQKVKAAGGSLKLRISSLSDSDSEEANVLESFEVNCSQNSQEQYVLLPQGVRNIRVDLISSVSGDSSIIAISPIIFIPQVLSLQENFMTISETKFSEMAKLSGIDDIAFCSFSHKDVVRHPLVMKIIQAYEKHDHLINQKKEKYKNTKGGKN